MAKIQHKRSSVVEGGAAKQPTSAQTEYGELCVNYSTEDPSLFIRDSADNIIKIGTDIENLVDLEYFEDNSNKVFISQTPPADPKNGSLWWSSALAEDGGGRLYVYYDGAWVDTSVPGGGAGNVLTESEANDLYLSKVNNDTAAGEITFEKVSTHEKGVSVTGGFDSIVGEGLTQYQADSLGIVAGGKRVLNITNQSVYVVGLKDNLTSDEVGISSQHTLSNLSSPSRKYWSFESDPDISGNWWSEVNHYYAHELDNSFSTAFAAGFYSNLSNVTTNASGGARKQYNFYAAGNAPSYFAGNVKVASSDNDNITSPQSSCVLLSADNIDITRRSGTADQGCLGLRRSAAANGGFISFSSADGSATDFGGTDARIRLSGYGNVVTTGITNTFSVSRIAVAPADITDAITTIKALAPNVTGFTAADLIANAPVAVIEDDAEKDEILVDQTKLIPLLTKALQEVMAKNEELETRLSALEGA